MLYLIHPLAFFNWKVINSNKQNYIINNSGFILSLKSKTTKFLKTRIDRAGYITVRLTQDGNTTTYFLHRLIAETFIPNTENKPFVNHINGIKTDNRIENLEWVTHSENIKHAIKIGLIPSNVSQAKIVTDFCTGKKYNSIKEAASYCKIPYSSLKNMLSGIRENKTCLRIAS